MAWGYSRKRRNADNIEEEVSAVCGKCEVTSSPSCRADVCVVCKEHCSEMCREDDIVVHRQCLAVHQRVPTTRPNFTFGNEEKSCLRRKLKWLVCKCVFKASIRVCTKGGGRS